MIDPPLAIAMLMGPKPLQYTYEDLIKEIQKHVDRGYDEHWASHLLEESVKAINQLRNEVGYWEYKFKNCKEYAGL